MTKCFLVWLYNFPYPLEIYEGSIVLHFQQVLLLLVFFCYSHLGVGDVASQCCLKVQFPNDKWHWASFHVLFRHSYIFYCKVSISIFFLLKKNWILLLRWWEWTYLSSYILDINLLFDIWYTNISLSLWLIFSFSSWELLKSKRFYCNEFQHSFPCLWI